MSLRSPLRRVKGLGAAHEGVSHWWGHRLGSLALVPLTIWFVASLVSLVGADYFTMREWIGSPVVAGLLILFLVAIFHHAALSLGVVIEDYVHNEAVKIAALIALKGATLLLALTGVLAVLSVLFGR
jgi:succinate dehydrogenase membrane anchor subunit